MEIRTEYVKYLSEGLVENKNAALGVANKYAKLLNMPLIDYGLLDEVYSELISLYIQSEVSLMQAFTYKMDYPAIDSKTAEIIKNDFQNIFVSLRDYICDQDRDIEKFSLPTGQQILIEYEDFEYIDEINRKAEEEREDFFEHLQKLVIASPHRMRLRELFINDKK